MKKFMSTLAVALPLTLGAALTVPAAYATDTTTKVANHLSDSAITTKIKAQMTADTTLNPLDISVSTHNGIVSLKGQVNSDTEYEHAVSMVQSSEGVKDVNTDDLTVKDSKAPLTDLAITAKIQGKLIQDNLFSNKDMAYWGFSIETKDQVVYLKGKVDSQQIKDNIMQVVKSTQGVKSVEDLLEVKS